MGEEATGRFLDEHLPVEGKVAKHLIRRNMVEARPFLIRKTASSPAELRIR
jgi:hypothetical protein